jgi:hypothetical protein
MVQPQTRDAVPPEPAITIEELARRQGIEPLASIDALAPGEPLFDEEEHAAFLKWLEELRHSEVA